MSKKEKTEADVTRFVEKVAEKQGWELQPDQEFLATIKKGLMTTHNRHGFFLCPCRDGAGDRDKDRDITCPCVYNVPDQKEYGHCFCGLFFAPGHLEKGGGFSPIPDRRPEELYDE